MPFGYTKYLLAQDKSQSTVDSYVKTVNMFFGFLNQKYKKEKELFEISAADIKEFLRFKAEKDSNSASTLNKHLTILKHFF